MNSKKAFLDTTILTDILLKPNGKGRTAKQALANYRESLLPTYAIKEFKAGPLNNFRWMHNKLAVTGSFADGLAALQSMSTTRRRYTTSTAIESLKEVATSISKAGVTNQVLVDRYGRIASLDVTLCDMYRNGIKNAIVRSWKRRRLVSTAVVQPLFCYEERAPYMKRGLIELDPTRCNVREACCLIPSLRKKNSDIKKLTQVLKTSPAGSEGNRRYRILHEIERKPTDSVSEEYCRGLGDAYFALFCPTNAVILTTNLKDHVPLAEALGKGAEAP